MKNQDIVIFLGVIVSLICKTQTFRCGRIPAGIVKPRNRNDAGRYILDVPGNPKTYSPNQRYNISLKLSPLEMTPRTFKSFIITLESEPSLDLLQDNIIYAPGHFEFGHDMLAKFSDRCPNTVVEANSLPKNEVQIFWTAPPPNSGCVAIKATIVESRDNWFSEDGPLTKILCEESSENENVQPMILPHCCACEEAKYEVAFEGLWTRNTHPKDFPSDVWSTKFSDVIGASHKLNNAFWEYKGIASPGLKDLAENGLTTTLESELKEMSENIRTIIKARGLQYPNITLSTFAVFRVDNENHLVSLVSKINPSPDWIVGVSNLELCRTDCTWEESRVLNLYPWDAGTDDGASYTSPDSPSVPQEPIRRIKSNSPNDPRSPFYDETGDEMKPIAKLHLIRQRLYEKICDESNQPSQEENENSACATSDWLEWSVCSNSCGEGVMTKQRQFINPEAAANCDKGVLVEWKKCYGTCEDNQRQKMLFESNDERCEVEVGEWSSCSVSCGKGSRTRENTFKKPVYTAYCSRSSGDLQETEVCEGEGKDCEDFVEPEIGEDCPQPVWGEWTSCNVTCGTGYKERYRMPGNDDDENKSNEDEEDCQNTPNHEVVECYEKPCEEQNEETHLFGNMSARNHNRGVLPDVLVEEPDGDVVDCKVSKWSDWGPCIVRGGKCGRGYQTKHREIEVHALNGGKPCPKRTLKKNRCHVPCDTNPTWGEATPPLPTNTRGGTTTTSDGCIMSAWSPYSPCSQNCGESAIQQRTRSIIWQPPGVNCFQHRLDVRRCNLPLACPEKGAVVI